MAVITIETANPAIKDTLIAKKLKDKQTLPDDDLILLLKNYLDLAYLFLIF